MEVKMFSSNTAAASRVPSAEEAMLFHLRDPAAVCPVHDAPPFVEV